MESKSTILLWLLLTCDLGSVEMEFQPLKYQK